MMADSLPRKVARACVERYSALPTTGKPSSREWTVLAGIVLVEGDDAVAELRVVALGTGTKCLTQSVEDGDAAGLRVRDGHAEVTVRRAFRRYLCAQLRLCFDGAHSVLEETDAAPDVDGAPRYQLRRGLRLFFFTSAPPCGDASMRAVDAVEEAIDAPSSIDCAVGTKRARAEPSIEGEANAGARAPPLCAPCSRTGAAGAVQRKPGRGEHTRCVSCSDKLARWAALGLQGAALSQLLEPVRIDALVVGGDVSRESLYRATWDRARAALLPWGAAKLRRFAPKQMALFVLEHAAADDDGATRAAALAQRVAFDVQRPPPATPNSDAAAIPNSNSINWCELAPLCMSEAVNGGLGLKLGANQHKLSRKHGSRLSKAAFFADVVDVCARAPPAVLPPRLAALGLAEQPPTVTYRRLKDAAEPYQQAKSALLRADGPFAAWMASPPHLEEFTLGDLARPVRDVQSQPGHDDSAGDGAAVATWLGLSSLVPAPEAAAAAVL
jgi:hypothetical protein